MSYILLITIHADPAMPPGYDEWGGTHTYMRELLDCFGSLHLNCILVTRKAMQELPYTLNCQVSLYQYILLSPLEPHNRS